jgi:uncharacterized repeat protein (TIGR01451 family)
MLDDRRRLLALTRSAWLPLAVAASLALSSRAARGAQETGLLPNIFHRPDTARRAASSGPGNLVFHGGPVMTSFTAYLIFWLPPGVHFSSSVSDANYEQLIMRYFQDIGGSPFYNIVTQYPGNNGTAANAVTLGGAIVDTRPYPRAGTVANPLLNADIRQEIASVMAAQGWLPGLGAMYFVYTGSGIQSCFDAAHTDCSQTQYCAYHSAFVSPDLQPVVYANMPDAYSLGDCGFANVNGDPAADVEISVTSHEHFEAVTDPILSGWFYGDFSGEIGDECAYDYGPGGGNTTPNVFLNGHPYRLQREWSNAPGTCALSLCGTSVCPPTVVLSTTATACIGGSAGDMVDYTLQYANLSDVDAATNVTLSNALPPGVQWSGGTVPDSMAGNLLTFDLPDIGVHGGGTIHFLTQLALPVPAFSLLTNSATLTFSDSLSDPRPAVVSSAATAVPCGPWCGNGMVDAGEQCDAGADNGVASSCCTASCTSIAAGTPCAPDSNICTDDVCDASGVCTHPNNTVSCDDGNACTTGESCSGGVCQGGTTVSCGACEVCDAASGCVSRPRTGCKLPAQSAKAKLQLKNDTDPAKDQLQWKWSNGAKTDLNELGDPIGSDDYSLCIFDMSGMNPNRIFLAQVPAGGTCGTKACWKQTGSRTPTGFQFSDKGGAHAGVLKLKLKAGNAGKAQMSLTAKGMHLTLPAMPLPLPLRVQLQRETGACWEANYSVSGLTKNGTDQFKAKAD